MYGLLIELKDGHADEKRLMDIMTALAPHGFRFIADNVYFCGNPQVTEVLVVHNAIMALRNLRWFDDAAERVTAFKVDTWGDITNAFRE